MKTVDLNAIVFDFDGVLTDNRVWLDSNGNELVSCSRSDGLAFSVLKRTQLRLYILSTEENPVVLRRGEKLGVKVIQGQRDKAKALLEIASAEGFSLARTLFVGNDINDIRAMQLCGFSACPSDSHFQVKKVAKLNLKTPGGKGVVREIVEDILEIDMLETWS